MWFDAVLGETFVILGARMRLLCTFTPVSQLWTAGRWRESPGSVDLPAGPDEPRFKCRMGACRLDYCSAHAVEVGHPGGVLDAHSVVQLRLAHDVPILLM